ncbi:tetratricopeptide repeat-containing sensor histidine kinase [Thermophagus sp. OGC60D27]|uniref:tetratricopeptide repeat-containing sensor histidine kinase n=1 Tax=Thermophagus sp. OGC60D27 TaxID=3458415 RepID=UPI00403782D7
MQKRPGLLILLFFLLISCRNEIVKESGIVRGEDLDLVGTDSVIVERLIERSMSVYGRGGLHVDVPDDYLSEAMDIASKNENNNQLARIYNLLGKRYRNLAQYGNAMKYHQKALALATKNGDKQLLGEVYNQLGVVYRRIDDNPTALEMHVKALTLAKETGDSLLISAAYNSIGNVNFNLNRFVTSMEYFKRSLDLAQRLNNKLGLAINHNNLGESLLKLGHVDSALFHFFSSLDYNYQIGSEVGQSICFNSIGGAYLQQGRPFKALEYLEKALHLNEDLGDLMQVAISHTKIGETYIQIGDMDLAESHLIKGLNVAREIGSLFQMEETTQLLSELCEMRGQYSAALDYFKMSAIYNDSIINEKNINHLATQEAVFESERQRKRIDELNKQTLQQKAELDRQRFFLTLALILVGAVSFAIIMLVRQSQLRHRYKNVRHQQRLLRSQMNPHFIFNALSAIQVYILEHDIEKSSRFLTDFARLMRLVLRSSTHDYISLKEETEILGYYLELQRLRFSEAFDYILNVDETLDDAKVMVPPMLTQPFIENAIEHGIRPSGTDGYISVKFIREGEKMIVEVGDNGIGIDASKKASEKEKGHESMAIKITRERLDMLRRDSGKSTDLVIMDKKQINPFDRGTLVRITLPVVEVENHPKKQQKNFQKKIITEKI